MRVYLLIPGSYVTTVLHIFMINLWYYARIPFEQYLTLDDPRHFTASSSRIQEGIVRSTNSCQQISLPIWFGVHRRSIVLPRITSYMFCGYSAHIRTVMNIQSKIDFQCSDIVACIYSAVSSPLASCEVTNAPRSQSEPDLDQYPFHVMHSTHQSIQHIV